MTVTLIQLSNGVVLNINNVVAFYPPAQNSNGKRFDYRGTHGHREGLTHVTHSDWEMVCGLCADKQPVAKRENVAPTNEDDALQHWRDECMLRDIEYGPRDKVDALKRRVEQYDADESDEIATPS